MRGMPANFIAEISRAVLRQITSLLFSLHAIRPLANLAQYNHKPAPSLGLVSGFGPGWRGPLCGFVFR